MRQRWYYAFAVKAAAFVLLAALLIGAGVGMIGVMFCGESGFYSGGQPAFADSWQARQICVDYGRTAERYLMDMFNRQLEGRGATLAEEDYFSLVRERLNPKNSNLKIVVEFPQNEVRRDFTDFLALKDDRQTEDWKLVYTYYTCYERDLSEAEMEDLGFEQLDGLLEITMYFYLDPMLSASDDFVDAYQTFQQMERYAYPALAALILCTLLGIADWVFLMCAMGHRPDVDKNVIVLRFIDKIPYELFIGVCSVIGVPLIVLVSECWITMSNSINAVAMNLIAAALIAGAAGTVLLLIILLLSTATRFKSRTLLRNTITWRVCAWCWRVVTKGADKVTARFQPREVSPEELEQKQEQRAETMNRWNARAQGVLGWFGGLFRALKNGIGHVLEAFDLWFADFTLMWKGQILLIGIILIDFLLVLMTFRSDGVLLMVLILFNIVVYLGYLSCLRQMYWLNEGAKKIASGDLNYRIDTDMMKWEFQKHGETLNTIRAGIDKAVDERMKAVEESVKSERMKNELLANVSHDIKTPLTSIINYVDLLKKEEVEGEKANEYIAVLDRQSIRLKKLLEDLLEASKASTGNIAVNAAPTSVGELLRQVTGEYAEKLAAAGLEPIITLPGKEATIYADGRLLWRIFDNLMANIVKYAMPQTRVYLDLRSDAKMTVIAVKNVSRDRLNIASDELMERFVRGDASRSTEGSGLGLSIAQSLTELMGGEFGLTIDGDLFKVTLTFPTMQYEPPVSQTGFETSAEEEDEAAQNGAETVEGEIVSQ